MSYEVDECVVPGGRPLGHPVTYNLQIVFGEQLGPCVAKVRLQRWQFVRHGVINAKLEDAIAVGPHVVHVSQARSHERSGGERKQGNGAKTSSPEFPAYEFHRCSFLDDAK